MAGYEDDELRRMLDEDERDQYEARQRWEQLAGEHDHEDLVDDDPPPPGTRRAGRPLDVDDDAPSAWSSATMRVRRRRRGGSDAGTGTGWDDEWATPSAGRRRMATRISYATSSLSRQFVATVVRTAVAIAVLLFLGRILLGAWHWWLAIPPALVAIWWLYHVMRENRDYIRRGGTPPPLPRRWG